MFNYLIIILKAYWDATYYREKKSHGQNTIEHWNYIFHNIAYQISAINKMSKFSFICSKN